MEFDRYVDGQTLLGLDKLILNNNYADATNMKEAIVYDMYRYLGADASLYNYVKVSINGEYWGVYLALEAVEDSFTKSMSHNYYLYESSGQLNIIPWDYNLAFGGMGMGNRSGGSGVVNDPIDTPFSGTEFFDTLMANEEYRAIYHEYLRQYRFGQFVFLFYLLCDCSSCIDFCNEI